MQIYVQLRNISCNIITYNYNYSRIVTLVQHLSKKMHRRCLLNVKRTVSLQNDAWLGSCRLISHLKPLDTQFMDFCEIEKISNESKVANKLEPTIEPSKRARVAFMTKEKLKHTIKVKNPKTKKSSDITLNGLNDFFGQPFHTITQRITLRLIFL